MLHIRLVVILQDMPVEFPHVLSELVAVMIYTDTCISHDVAKKVTRYMVCINTLVNKKLNLRSICSNIHTNFLSPCGQIFLANVQDNLYDLFNQN